MYTLCIFTVIALSDLTNLFIEKNFISFNPKAIILLYGGSILLLWKDGNTASVSARGRSPCVSFLDRASDLYRGTIQDY